MIFLDALLIIKSSWPALGKRPSYSIGIPQSSTAIGCFNRVAALFKTTSRIDGGD
jgi:hypothetical protein